MRIELVRLTGTGSAASDPQLQPLIDGAAMYVQRERPTTTGQVQVLFDEPALSAAIEATGEVLWGTERPLVWIELPAEDAAGDAAMRARLVAAADARGLPITIATAAAAGPAGAADAAAPAAGAPHAAPSAGAAATVPAPGGAAAPAAAAPPSDPRAILDQAQRAGANAGLVAEVVPAEPGMLQWMLVSPDTTARWVGGPELAVDNAADALAGIARRLEQAPAAPYDCRISGVGDLPSLVNVLAAVRAAPGVSSVAISAVDGDVLTLHLEARGGAPQLAHALIGDHLQPAGAAAAAAPATAAGATAAAGAPGEPLQFRYVSGP